MRAGERTYDLKRIYDASCGITQKDDTMPNRILMLRQPNLPPPGKMLSQYYTYRGWD